MTFEDLHRMAVAQDAGPRCFAALPPELQAMGSAPVRMTRVLLDWISANVDATGRDAFAVEIARALSR